MQWSAMKVRIGKAIKLLGALLFIAGVMIILVGAFGAYNTDGIAGVKALFDFTNIKTLISIAIALLPGYILYRVGCMIANCKRVGQEIDENNDVVKEELENGN